MQISRYRRYFVIGEANVFPYYIHSLDYISLMYVMHSKWHGYQIYYFQISCMLYKTRMEIWSEAMVHQYNGGTVTHSDVM